MSINHNSANEYLAKLFSGSSQEQLAKSLQPKNHPSRTKIPRNPFIKPKAVQARWDTIQSSKDSYLQLMDARTQEQMNLYQRNIENFIGTVKLPVGIAGPIRVNGLHAQDDYYIPLATTEAALVASYNRGAQLITQAGGAASAVLSLGVSRAPGFAFSTLVEAGMFVSWVTTQYEVFCKVAATTTRFGELKDMRVTLEGNHVYVSFEYTTADASGQNMVTIATAAVVDYIIENSPVNPDYHFLEANLSGDKKASALSFLTVRGKKVATEVSIASELIEKVLHTTPQRMVDYWRMSALGGVLSGTIGVQGHYANGLAAMYIACGQDAACVSESSVGVTRFEINPSGGLYASVTLPNLIVGTVGGGTGLPSQQACLEILGLAGSGNAMAFAEVCAAVCLAGELSIIGALCADDFSRAHKQLARG